MTTTLLPPTHYSVWLLQALEDLDGIEVLVYANRDESNRSVPVHNVKLVWSNSLAYPLQIIRQVVRDRPDLVHLQHEIGMYGGKLGAVLFPFLLGLLRLLGRRTVVTVHAVADARQVNPDFARAFAWNPGRLPLAVTRLVLAFVYRSIAFLASAIITHTPGLSDALVTRYGADPAKISVIPIGVPSPADTGSLARPTRLRLQEEEQFILCFGYIVRRKGLEHLLDAFEVLHARFSGCKLVLAGGARDPTYLAEMQAWVNGHGLERWVVFTGLLSESEISWLFSRARLAVFTYQHSVSASHPLTFAIGHGCPVVAPAIGTFAEEIHDGIDGLLVPTGNPQALAQAMERLLIDDHLRRDLQSGMAVQRQERSWAQVALMTRAVYQGPHDD